MAKTNRQINKEAEVSDAESTPAVVAYRVAQLENTQKEGFRALNDKLDGYVVGFVNEKEYQEARVEAKIAHTQLQKQVDDLKRNFKWWATFFVGLLGALAAIIVALKSHR